MKGYGIFTSQARLSCHLQARKHMRGARIVCKTHSYGRIRRYFKQYARVALIAPSLKVLLLRIALYSSLLTSQHGAAYLA
jgi:hypothetical protein